MGYYTEFELCNQLTEEQQEKLIKISDGYDLYTLTLGEPCKWYKFKENVIEFSKLYPSELFEWSGLGEEQPDNWKAYVKNGKFCRIDAIITFQEFNETMLK